MFKPPNIATWQRPIRLFQQQAGHPLERAQAEFPPLPAQAESDILPLGNYMDINSWATRDMGPSDRLLGDLLTTTSRIFFVGRTGLGKTQLAMGVAVSLACGRDFLHWKCHRQGRVLLVDGELPGELIRQRANDAIRRAVVTPEPGQLIIYARDSEDDFARRFSSLGRMKALNRQDGREWVLKLVKILRPDVVIFDNVMSLIEGDQKDEVPWSDTLPLVSALTARRVRQIWLDHTGHNGDRQYGSSTKAWRFAAVGIMKPLEGQRGTAHEMVFTLSFEHPGKVRRRTPDNWRDFDTRTIRLTGDRWTSEPTTKDGKQFGNVAPCRVVFHDALLDVIAEAGSNTVTRAD